MIPRSPITTPAASASRLARSQRCGKGEQKAYRFCPGTGTRVQSLESRGTISSSSILRTGSCQKHSKASRGTRQDSVWGYKSDGVALLEQNPILVQGFDPDLQGGVWVGGLDRCPGIHTSWHRSSCRRNQGLGNLSSPSALAMTL